MLFILDKDLMAMKMTLPLALTALLLLPIGIQAVYASSGSTSTTGTATVLATCGIAIGTGSPIAFGSVTASVPTTDTTALTFSNSGSVTGTITVAGSNWLASSVVHIAGQKTAFQTTDQNGGTEFGTYASFTKFLNSTNGFVTFGNLIPGTNVNATYWGLNPILTNTPFSGALTQTITFDETC